MTAPARVVDIDGDTGEIDVSMEQLGVAAAEVNSQIATAKRYPRSLQRFRQSLITQVTMTEEIAASCIYALPRAGKKIEGPSIRFAEIAMGCWGNCRASARIVAETENFIVAQGIFIDLERNVAVGMEVNRRIVNAKGQRFDIDMIGVTGSAASSIALRNAILRGIPRALFEEGYIAAKKTVAGVMDTLAERRVAALKAFAPYNVTQQQVLAALGKQGLVEVGLEDLVTLAGMLTSIQQGDKDPEEIFPQATRADGAPQRQKAPPEKPAGDAKPNADQTSSPRGDGGRPAGADEQKADDGSGGADASPPAGDGAAADASDDDRPPTELETSIANELIDCKLPADVDAVAKMFADDIRAADKVVQNAILLQLANVREAMANRGDLFPGDRQ